MSSAHPSPKKQGGSAAPKRNNQSRGRPLIATSGDRSSSGQRGRQRSSSNKGAAKRSSSNRKPQEQPRVWKPKVTTEAEQPPTETSAVGPAWTRGEIEKPAGIQDMQGWSQAVYTPEQQQRLGVDEIGQPHAVASSAEVTAASGVDYSANPQSPRSTVPPPEDTSSSAADAAASKPSWSAPKPRGWSAPQPRGSASASTTTDTAQASKSTWSSSKPAPLAHPCMPVVLFSRPGCPSCSKTKCLLRACGTPFALVDVSAEPDRLTNSIKTVPQVFVGQRCLGGLEEIKRLDDAKELTSALSYRFCDGPAIAPTPADKLEGGTLVPADVRAALLGRAAELQKLDYSPGSQPSMRAFLRYAVTRKAVQDQRGNVPLNFTSASLPPALHPPLRASQLITFLRQTMLQLLDDFADPASGDVDYLSMRESSVWSAFLALSSEISHKFLLSDLMALNEAERKAFLINLYNAMIFHGVVVYGRRGDPWSLYCFFVHPSVTYSLAGVPVSLDDVEHGMLRARNEYFKEQGMDLQRHLRLPHCDPRIHMALNCGAKGCPPVGVYEATSIEADLDSAVQAFVADDRHVRVSRDKQGTLRPSFTELFKMYLEDFIGEHARSPGSAEACSALIRWVLPFASGEKRGLLEGLVKPGAPAVTAEWLPYDWATNGPDLPLDNRIYRPRLLGCGVLREAAQAS